MIEGIVSASLSRENEGSQRRRVPASVGSSQEHFAAMSAVPTSPASPATCLSSPEPPRPEPPARWWLAIPCLPLALLLGIVVLVIAALTAPVAVLVPSSTPPCCASELRLLSQLINTTINPCRNLFARVCASYKRNETPGSLRDIRLGEEPARYRPTGSETGRLINKHFQVCLRAMSKAEELAPETVASITEFMGREAFKTETNMLRFVVEITLRYGLQTTVLFLTTDMREIIKKHVKTYQQRPGTNVSAVVITRPVLLEIEGSVSPLYDRVRLEALEAVNEALSTNVTTHDIEALVRNLTLVEDEMELVSSDVDVLTTMVPSVPGAQWRMLLDDIAGTTLGEDVFHTSTSAIKHRLGVLLDVKSQPTTVAFLIVDAASNFILNMMKSRLKTSIYERYFRRCNEEGQTLVPLLAIHRLRLTAGQKRAEQFRTIFERIASLVADTAPRFAAPKDAESVKQYVYRFRMTLPVDIFRLNASLPTLGDRYAWNYMQLQASGWTAQRMPLPKNVPRKTIKDSIETKHLTVLDDTIYVSLGLYTAMNISNDYDPAIAYATIGMSLADALWNSVFKRHFSHKTTRLFDVVKKCRAASGHVFPKVVFRYAELSLNVTLEAARSKQWFGKFRARGLTNKASRCQLFFELLIFHYYCPGHIWKQRVTGQESNYLFSNTDDYHTAFGCSWDGVRDNATEACFEEGRDAILNAKGASPKVDTSVTHG
ncbi:hypothetical protein HPB50_022381 [Hyalomma asiaticum]|uniref:Uncharacterized protein n=1 Tax=Hyalomma asiaticum TaxID=266040 RepID=A0ACB7S8E0_HYAAI|nr:hypothetical protein HPB50_022381 [Hyalomma asiaticum]